MKESNKANVHTLNCFPSFGRFLPMSVRRKASFEKINPLLSAKFRSYHFILIKLFSVVGKVFFCQVVGHKT